MLNPINFLSKFSKSSNQKELDKANKTVQKINSLEDNIKNLHDTHFPKNPLELQKQIKEGKNIKHILPEAFV